MAGLLRHEGDLLPDRRGRQPRLALPPNHEFVKVPIEGVTDPDGDPVAITITGITQDEPLDSAARTRTGSASAPVPARTVSTASSASARNRPIAVSSRRREAAW